MSQQRLPLDTLQLTNPCRASWEEMVGDDRVRFCRQCQLNVHNISAMTRKEAEALIRKMKGRVCLGFSRRPDGTILTQDCSFALWNKRRKLARLVACVAGALLGCLAILTGSVANLETMAGVQHIPPFNTVLDWLFPPAPPLPQPLPPAFMGW